MWNGGGPVLFKFISLLQGEPARGEEQDVSPQPGHGVRSDSAPTCYQGQRGCFNGAAVYGRGAGRHDADRVAIYVPQYIQPEKSRLRNSSVKGGKSNELCL